MMNVKGKKAQNKSQKIKRERKEWQMRKACKERRNHHQEAKKKKEGDEKKLLTITNDKNSNPT